MRYLLILLLFSCLCNAQKTYDNTVKVKVFRLVREYNEYMLPPSSIKGYMKRETFIGRNIQYTETSDEALANRLVVLKESAIAWPEEPFITGTDTVKTFNMFVIEINRYRDTIYTTKNNTALVFPAAQKVYTDTEGLINTAFTEDFKTFFDRDFLSEMQYYKKDSIAFNSVTINSKPIYGLTRKKFESQVAKFQLVRVDSIYDAKPYVQKEYWLNNIKATIESKIMNEFHAIHLPVKYPQTFAFSAGGISTGDPEQKVLDAFPCSTLFKNKGADFIKPDDNYFYEVALTDGKGYAIYYIRNKIVHEIEIGFF